RGGTVVNRAAFRFADHVQNRTARRAGTALPPQSGMPPISRAPIVKVKRACLSELRLLLVFSPRPLRYEVRTRRIAAHDPRTNRVNRNALSRAAGKPHIGGRASSRSGIRRNRKTLRSGVHSPVKGSLARSCCSNDGR